MDSVDVVYGDNRDSYRYGKSNEDEVFEAVIAKNRIARSVRRGDVPKWVGHELKIIENVIGELNLPDVTSILSSEYDI